ncbi:hypothetical protein Q3C01_05235 [Bradyrhizobium sp. UFLA05-109]
MKAYVYAIVVDGVIRYVGKGSGGRARAHMRIVRSIARRRAAGELVQASYFYNRLTKAWLAGAEIEERMLISGLDHEAAFQAEIETIASFPSDQLWNFWPGGEGSSKGYAKSEQQRRKIAESNKRTWADEGLRSQHRERSKVHWLRPEYRERVLIGRAATDATPESRSKRSAAAITRWADHHFRAQIKQANSSDQHRMKRSLAAKAGWSRRRSRSQMGGDNSVYSTLWRF